MSTPRRPRLPRSERQRLVLDAAERLFVARGVHEVGMDELIGETGLGKATVYRLFPSKDALVGAYLDRSAATILAAIDRDLTRHADDPAAALGAIFDAVAADVARPGFRGCRFNNASVEFPDRTHPARAAARSYRAALLDRLTTTAERLRPGDGERTASVLALLIDGMYVSAVHLGPSGPAAHGRAALDAVLTPVRPARATRPDDA